MQLIYKTDDSGLAHALHDLLERHGIPAALHGGGAHGLGLRQGSYPLSLWVVRDEDEARALALLERFFADEAGPRGPFAPPRPVNRRLRAVLVFLGTFAAVLLACAAAFGR